MFLYGSSKKKKNSASKRGWLDAQRTEAASSLGPLPERGYGVRRCHRPRGLRGTWQPSSAPTVRIRWIHDVRSRSFGVHVS